MTASSLMKRFAMSDHVENGSFIETHYNNPSEERAASGSIYYYVAPFEKTEFHVIDCDEYWCYALGDPLELWLISKSGELSVRHLGVEENCEPAIYIPKGTIFASRSSKNAADGTFITCITVPRFSYSGFRLLKKEEIEKEYPQVSAFFD